MSNSSYHSPSADGEGQNCIKYGKPFSRQAASRHSAMDVDVHSRSREQPQEKEASALKAPYCSDQSYRRYDSVGPVANQKAVPVTGVSSRHTSHSAAAKASTSHSQVPVAQQQGRDTAPFPSGPAIGSSRGQQYQIMKGGAKEADGSSSAVDWRQHGRSPRRRGFDAISGVSTTHKRRDVDAIDRKGGHERRVATASAPMNYRLAAPNADLASTSIDDPRAQVGMQKISPTNAGPAIKKARPNSKGIFYQDSRGLQGAVAHHDKGHDLVSVSAIDTGHVGGIFQDNCSVYKSLRVADREENHRLATTGHDAFQHHASRNSEGAATARAVEGNNTTHSYMDAGSHGQQFQHNGLQLLQKRSSRYGNAVDGLNEYSQHEVGHDQGGCFISEEAIEAVDDYPHRRERVSKGKDVGTAHAYMY